MARSEKARYWITKAQETMTELRRLGVELKVYRPRPGSGDIELVTPSDRLVFSLYGNRSSWKEVAWFLEGMLAGLKLALSASLEKLGNNKTGGKSDEGNDGVLR